MTPDKQAAQLQSLLTAKEALLLGIIELYKTHTTTLEQLLQATRRNGESTKDENNPS